MYVIYVHRVYDDAQNVAFAFAFGTRVSQTMEKTAMLTFNVVIIKLV